MKRKGNLLAIMLATSLVFAGCANDNANETDTNDAAVEESAETETTEAEETDAPAEDEEGEAEEETTDDEEDKDEENEEETDDTADEATSEENELVLHRAYPSTSGEAFATVVVATSGDTIVDAFVDEYQYFDKDSEYVGVPNSDKAFGEGSKEDKILGSKRDNDELYSKDALESEDKAILEDNYSALTDYVKGKSIEELEKFLEENDDDAIIETLGGEEYKESPELLQYVVDTAKNDDFSTTGTVENLDDIELKYAIGAPHGERSFGNAVVALEGDKIIAASIDEFQYLEAGNTSLDIESEFAQNYADDNIFLTSKLENDEVYSDLMTEKAEATKTIKENFEAIEDFVAGKTIEEVKEVVDNATPGEEVEAVSGATLVDTVGYLELILDAAEK